MIRYVFQYRNQIIVLVICLIFGVIIKKNISRYLTEEEEVKKDRIQAEENKALFEEWNIVNKQINDLEKNFFRRDTLIFKRFIEEKAQAAEISLEYLGPSQEDKGFYWETTINLRISAAYKNVIDFLSYLENKNIRITKLVMKESGAGRKADIIIAGMTLKD